MFFYNFKKYYIFKIFKTLSVSYVFYEYNFQLHVCPSLKFKPKQMNSYKNDDFILLISIFFDMSYILCDQMIE